MALGLADIAFRVKARPQTNIAFDLNAILGKLAMQYWI
jgi:hypothetical protein